MAEWTKAGAKKKSKKYTPPDWAASIRATVDSMISSEFFVKVTEQLDARLLNTGESVKLVILGLGQGLAI